MCARTGYACCCNLALSSLSQLSDHKCHLEVAFVFSWQSGDRQRRVQISPVPCETHRCGAIQWCHPKAAVASSFSCQGRTPLRQPHAPQESMSPPPEGVRPPLTNCWICSSMMHTYVHFALKLGPHKKDIPLLQSSWAGAGKK